MSGDRWSAPLPSGTAPAASADATRGAALRPSQETVCLNRPAARVLNLVRERRDHLREANVTRGTSESIFSWRSLVGAAVPPRDPNEDEDEEDEEDGGDEDDDREPAVIREPDED